MTFDELREANLLLIYGGTFDPPHRAHTELPMLVRRQLGADAVIFVPAGRPPHKDSPTTPADHRRAMLELALADHPYAVIDAVELDRSGPSYTVDTLADLRHRLGPRPALRLLIGADMALIFHKWREHERIAALAEPLVMLRPPHDREQLIRSIAAATGQPAEAWAGRIVPVPLMDISSTDLRRALTQHGPHSKVARAWLSEPVRNYIAQHSLYQRS